MPLTAKYMCRLLPCTCPRRCHATQSPPSAPDVHNPNRKGIKLDPDISRVGGKWFVRCRRVRSGPSRCRCPGCGNGASRCRSRYRAADADTAGEDAGQAEPHRLSERCGSEVLVVGSQLVRLACAQKHFPELKKYFPEQKEALTTTRVNVHVSHTCNIYRVFVSASFRSGKCFFRSGKYFCPVFSRSNPNLGNENHFPGQSSGSTATDFISQVWTCTSTYM
jgi:hypothetical protein